MSGIAEHNAVIRELCAAEGVPCIDFAPAMEQRADLWQDPVHVTPEGSALKARLIAGELVDQL